jgi:hypothetical protein
MREFNIFISQSTGKSRDVAQVVTTWLREDMRIGNPWIASSDIDGGDDFREAINEALREARFGIFFFTTENLANQWMLYEVGFLLSRGVPIFPYAIDTAKLSDIPPPIKQGSRVAKAV